MTRWECAALAYLKKGIFIARSPKQLRKHNTVQSYRKIFTKQMVLSSRATS